MSAIHGASGVCKSSRKLYSEDNGFSSKITTANALLAGFLLRVLRIPGYSPGCLG